MRGRAALSIAAILFAVIATPAAAVSSISDQVVSGSLTQTHYLYYNMQSCSGTAYAYVSWKTLYHRTAGADRDTDTTTYRVDAIGGLCNGTWSPHQIGPTNYHPASFGSGNDVWATQTLNWPYLKFTVLDWSGSAQKAHYTRRGGGPWVQTLCNEVTFNTEGKCSTL